MFWPIPGSKKSGSRSSKPRRREARRLFFESLETREVLSAGVVDVQIGAFAPPGTGLALVGDGSNNEVEIHQTFNLVQVGEYTIQGKNGTLLSLNGVGATMNPIVVNGVNNDILVDLRTGDDTFSFLGTAAGGISNVPANLVINNDQGSNRNTIQDVLVNGDLSVTKKIATVGYSELQILHTTVIGYTAVDNTGAGTGDTKTVIDNSWLQGNGGGGPAFELDNPTGYDTLDIRGNSQFGLSPFQITGPVVDIENGGGGSRTSFTGASAIAGFGTTTVYGELDIDNGLNLPGFLDTVTFNGTNVLGAVNIDNGDGDTSTTVTNSTLGSHLVLGSNNLPALGGPLMVLNDAGYDQFSMTQSTAPWGIKIDNAGTVNPSANWGSAIAISQSSIGTGPYGPRVPLLPSPVAGDAMIVVGDNGRDVVNVDLTTLGGRLDLQLAAGNNELNITNNSKMAGLYLVTLGGNDKVLIDKSTIQVDVYVRLGYGADTFRVTNVTFATQWPDPLLGSVSIDGEQGVDSTNLSTLVPASFEVLVP